MHWRIEMKMKSLNPLLICFTLISCGIDPDPIKQDGSGEASVELVEQVESSGIAAKNFAQINNTYASLTGVSAGDVSTEYGLIKMQLPASSNPRSLNGFNQIASSRLAFAYCNPYIDGRADLDLLSNEDAIKNLLNSFIDVNPEKNSDHKKMFTQLEAIMSDEDSLINDNNADRKRKKLLKLTCTAILASSYVTLI